MIIANTSSQLTANNIVNRGGTINSGVTTQLTALQDIVNQSGTIQGTNVNLTAGRDVSSETVVANVDLGNFDP